MSGLRRAAGRVATVAAALSLVAAPAAAATPPPNDLRESATEVQLPSTVRGTTVDATLSPGESDRINGTLVSGDVWYRVTAGQAQPLILGLSADGNLDAGIEIYRRARSQLRLEGSGLTDEAGKTTLIDQVREGAVYLIRVARLANSEPGTFTLLVRVPKGPPLGPGPLLVDGSAKGSVDPLDKTADAYSAILKAGTTYRINLVNKSSRPLGFGVYAPGTQDFQIAGRVGSSRPYQLFTPRAGEGGRYAFLITATGLGAPQKYGLHVAPARRDDLWPGRRLHNYRRIDGTLNARHADVVDTYRFDLVSRSAVTVKVHAKGGARLFFALRRADGTRLGARSEEFVRTLGAGRYVITVTAAPGVKGAYTVWRAARLITSLRMSAAPPLRLGQPAVLRLQLTPAESGKAIVDIERFDPATGWHFSRRMRTSITAGTGSVAFTPTEGRWRARATFVGTRRAQASQTPGDTRFDVLTPLDPN